MARHDHGAALRAPQGGRGGVEPESGPWPDCAMARHAVARQERLDLASIVHFRRGRRRRRLFGGASPGTDQHRQTERQPRSTRSDRRKATHSTDRSQRWGLGPETRPGSNTRRGPAPCPETRPSPSPRYPSRGALTNRCRSARPPGSVRRPVRDRSTKRAKAGPWLSRSVRGQSTRLDQLPRSVAIRADHLAAVAGRELLQDADAACRSGSRKHRRRQRLPRVTPHRAVQPGGVDAAAERRRIDLPATDRVLDELDRAVAEARSWHRRDGSCPARRRTRPAP